MKRFDERLRPLGAFAAGAAGSGLLLFVLVQLPESWTAVRFDPETFWRNWLLLLYLVALSFVVFGVSGLLAGLLSPARWTGPALGILWLLLGAFLPFARIGLLSLRFGALLVAALTAPTVLQAALRRRLRQREARRESLALQLQPEDRGNDLF